MTVRYSAPELSAFDQGFEATCMCGILAQGRDLNPFASSSQEYEDYAKGERAGDKHFRRNTYQEEQEIW